MLKGTIRTFAAIAVCLCGLVSAVPGQQVLKVAVVDSQKAFETSIPGKAAIARLREKENTINSRLADLDRQILTFETRLKTQNLTLTLDARQQLSLDLENLQVKRKRVQEDSSREYVKLRERLFAKAQRELLTVIRGYAEEQAFNLVFDLAAPGVVYFDQAFDITDEVIKRYDASGKR